MNPETTDTLGAARPPKKTISPTELVPFPIPVLAVKGAICFNCLQYNAKGEILSRCKGCLRVSYCSLECQKADWKKAHKNVCVVLQEINKLDAPCGPRTWEEYRGDMWMRIDAFRAHPKKLKINEERILQYQSHCATCHRNVLQLSPTSKLRICETCNLAHHCSTCTPSTHYQHCPRFAQVALSERFAISHFLTSLQPNVTLFTETPRETYMPLSQAASWRDYYTVVSDQGAHLSALLTPSLDPVNLPKEYGEAQKMLDMSCALKAGTDKLSMMLTILAGLEAVFTTSLESKEKLTLHLIGATPKELDALMLFEELLHLLPNLKALHTIFIGPDLPPPSSPGVITLDCCEPCTKLNRVRTITMFKGTYTSYMRSLDVFRAPDLGVLFHTGHSQEAIDSWAPAIKYLAQAPFPSVFTCYNGKEMEEEVAGLEKMGARFLVRGERNKWAGLRMLLEVAEREEGAVFCMNLFWYVVAAAEAK